MASEQRHGWTVKPAIALIRAYQKTLSPAMGRNCRFSPSCSEYAAQALETHGLLKGAGLAARRIGRCQPLFDGGYDPVPGRGAVSGGSGGVGS